MFELAVLSREGVVEEDCEDVFTPLTIWVHGVTSGEGISDVFVFTKSVR